MKQALKCLVVGSLFFVGLMSSAEATVYTTLFTKSSELDTSNTGFNSLNFLNTAPNGIFATLTFNSLTNAFTLKAAVDLNDYFGAGTIIDAISFETNQDRSQLSDANVSGGGISNFVESTGGPDFSNSIDDFDVTYTFNNDLTANETVAFTLVGNNPNCLTAVNACAQNANPLLASTFAIRITRNVQGTDPASWALGASIDPISAVPENETLAMFLVGLGLLGFVSYRKQA